MPTLTLGDFELSVFSDGTYLLDGGAFFGVIPKIMWSRKMEADERNYVQSGLNSLLIRTGKQTVLVETGMGNKLSERMVKFYGQPAQVARKSYRRLESLPKTSMSSSTLIFISTTAAGIPSAAKMARSSQLFRARNTTRRKANGSMRGVRASAMRSATSPTTTTRWSQSGQMTLLKGGEEIVPGISVKTFPGHTAHMQAVIVTSGGRTACYISDLIPTAAHIDITWGMGFDLYPLQTIESKKQYYAKSIPEKWLTVFTHDAKTPWAYVEKDELGKMVALGV
jgi:hypothetical protein